MSLDGSPKTAQKGWLLRWTRKQWSRHWFVLKNGSLTYYRGPAAELCSFLDGVLDLSLIKHIEVHQQQQPDSSQQPAGQASSYSHYSHSHAAHTGNGAPATQFTFTLKMWNGECHLLGATSAAERGLWLEAISACSSETDDELATDSASSSDSSPTSNLSGKSFRAEQQLSFDQLSLSLKSVIKRRELDLVGVTNRSIANSTATSQELAAVQRELPGAKSGQVCAIKHPQQDVIIERQPEVQRQAAEHSSSQQQTQQQQQQQQGENGSQASKRRLVCPSSPLIDLSSSEPKLIARQPRPAIDLYAGPHDYPIAMSDVGEQPDQPEQEPVRSDSESGPPPRERRLPSEPEHYMSDGHEPNSAREPTAEPSEGEGRAEQRTSFSKQKKRVTFDLSRSSMHHLSGSSSGSSCDSDSECTLSSSPASSVASSDDEDEQALDSASGHQTEPAERGTPEQRPEGASNLLDSLISFPMEIGVEQAGEAVAAGPRLADVEARLERALSNIGQLERQLSTSYANYSQLEESYQRLQEELVKCDELHKGELTRLQLQVEQLTRDLAAGELRLVEAHEKLLKYEQQVADCGGLQQLGRQSKALGWLRQAGQQVTGAGGQSPLLLIHSPKPTALHQHTLGLKLLSHSKQIHRKLSRLELKMDQIQCPSAGSLVN